MSNVIEYRARAQEQRRAAEISALPMVCERLRQAAERWDYLADEIERCERGMLNLSARERQTMYRH